MASFPFQAKSARRSSTPRCQNRPPLMPCLLSKCPLIFDNWLNGMTKSKYKAAAPARASGLISGGL